MKFLKAVERDHYARFEKERFGLFAQREFRLVVLFEVEVAQLLIYLDVAVKILYVVVVCLPQVFDGGQGHRAGVAPSLLQLAESVEGLAHGLTAADKRLDIFDYGFDQTDYSEISTNSERYGVYSEKRARYGLLGQLHSLFARSGWS